VIPVLAGFSYIEEREKNLELAGESVVKVSEQDGQRVVTVVEPYLLTENTRGTDCLECHPRIASGTVGGAAENQRIKVALDQVSANVMLADPDRNIVFANRATQRILEEVQDDFRRELPGFEAHELMGAIGFFQTGKTG
jgi:hypothetical protein